MPVEQRIKKVFLCFRKREILSLLSLKKLGRKAKKQIIKIVQHKKALENARFTGFSRASDTFVVMRLHSGLSCNLCREVVYFLLDSFACLKTYKLLNCHVCTVLFSNFFHILGNCQIAVLYVYLV